MTTKEFQRLKKIADSDRRFKLDGYFMLYPDSIKYINQPSDFLIQRSEKRMDLFVRPDLHPWLEGEFFVFPKSSYMGKKSSIHYKHIKSTRIYHYNY